MTGKYSRYDPTEDVIFTDITGLLAKDTKIIDLVFDELIGIARRLHHKVYVVGCWKDVKVSNPTIAIHYGNRSAELLIHVRGVVRYAADDPLTRAYVRTEMLKHQMQGTRSNLFGTREQALQAVRQLERGE